MKPAILISIALFLAACALPALEFKRSWGPPEVWRGWEVLAFGWNGVFFYILGWLANPLWIASLVYALPGKPKAAVAGWLALLFAATILIDMRRTLPGDEGGVTTQTISRLLPGFYFWIASLLTLPVCTLIQRTR
jgi:hypothetical protein